MMAGVSKAYEHEHNPPLPPGRTHDLVPDIETTLLSTLTPLQDQR